MVRLCIEQGCLEPVDGHSRRCLEHLEQHRLATQQPKRHSGRMRDAVHRMREQMFLLARDDPFYARQ